MVNTLDNLAFDNGTGIYRPRGKHSLVEAVELISRAITLCRDREVKTLLVNTTGFTDVPVPTLVDRFLMVEDWAQESKGLVIVAMVASPEYLHPRKFGVIVARQFGLVCDVFTVENAAAAWLQETARAANPGP